MDKDELVALIQYYRDQAGGSLQHYQSPSAINMRGHGIGSFLGGLYRMVLPLLKSPTSKNVGKFFINSAADVLNDFSENPTMGTLKSSLKRNSTSAASNVANEIAKKMRGEGLIVGRKLNERKRKVSKKSKQCKLKKMKKSSIKGRAKNRKRTVSDSSSTSEPTNAPFGYLN